ncbi:MAG: hypothetical protein M1812_006558 [Candelaria pacifica]|nr:MAG: hypothetical protein M1812_006558 [Candelaria pacifica]
MGKAGRERRFLEYQKDIQTISFSLIPGEIRNRIYDEIILAAYGTPTPIFSFQLRLQPKGAFWRNSKEYANIYLKHAEIVPWIGFRVATGEIYREFSGALIAATTFSGFEPKLLSGALAIMPQFENIRYLELDPNIALQTEDHQLVKAANDEIRKIHPGAGAGGFWGPYAFESWHFRAFRLDAATIVGQQVLKIAKELQLKTLAIDVYRLQDKRERLYRNRSEWRIVQEIASLATSNTEVRLVDFGLTQHSQTASTWCDADRIGERTGLAAGLEMQSMRIQREDVS